jgi:hypothetical protein
MPSNHLKLAWDIEQSQVKINNTTIRVASPKLVPEAIDCVVEEQDTALILSKPTHIKITDDKPSWFLANALESQTLLQPGTAVLRSGKPKKILAIVHDLDQEPSWRTEWVTQALENIFEISRSYGFEIVSLPILATVHGRFDRVEFLKLLVNAIQTQDCPLKTMWLTAPREECFTILSSLQLVTNQN